MENHNQVVLMYDGRCLESSSSDALWERFDRGVSYHPKDMNVAVSSPIFRVLYYAQSRR